jgi:rRNA processing protein Gar1
MKNFNINDVVYNKHYNTIGIVLDRFDFEDLRTDADGVVYSEDCIKVNSMNDLEKYINDGVSIAPSTLEKIKRDNLL